MNKGDLINAVAESAGITKAQAGSAVDAVFSGIEASLKAGDKAAFVGFGTFLLLISLQEKVEIHLQEKLSRLQQKLQ